MKSFLFENIWLLSRKEKKARMIQFSSGKNLVFGRNHTGKSSLIKNLFVTLGARPKGKLEKWDVKTISAVDFNFDGKKYRVVHYNGNRAMFDFNGDLIAAADNHREWSDAFAKAVDFNLVLTDKNLETVNADPKCFFLPFYIDQDGSWGATWDTFVGLQQYKSPIGGILEYFTGIKPPKYYEVQSSKAQTLKNLSDLIKEEKILSRARERFDRTLSLSGPKITEEVFRLEIDRLTIEITQLNTQQEKLRDTIVREKEMLHEIQLQIGLANDALKIYDEDYAYIQKGEVERLSCPTCGAEHDNSFLELLNHAEEARGLRELVVKLGGDADKIRLKHKDSLEELSLLEVNYNRIADILNTRKGDLKFSDVVEGIGAEKAFKVFEEEYSEIKYQVDICRLKIIRYDQEIQKLKDIVRSKKILKAFRESYKNAIIKLNLPPTDTDKVKLVSRPSLSGSGGPRFLLAYYTGLWGACRGVYANFSIPFIIDSPNQQGQDEINLPVVMNFISTHLPEKSQVILGTEIDVNFSFDKKITFDRPYSLLIEEEFDRVSFEIEPLIEKLFVELKIKKYS